MTSKSIKWTDCNTAIVLKILEASKNGITNRQIMNKFQLSHVQLRRCLAELIDKRLLHYDDLQHVYNTTDRGIIYIKNIQESMWMDWKAIIDKIYHSTYQPIVVGLNRIVNHGG